MAQPAPIEQFGKYQILERVARGGMAEIFKARMEGIGGFNRLFAIKRIVPGLSQNREYIDLLVDEAKIAGLLSHANIVQILDLGQVGGQYYVAMEYVEGRDLGNVLRRCRERGITLPVPHAVFILIEVLKGLEYAHNRQIMRGNRPMPLNIIHRDVSPSNVLVSFQGEVKLTDFGIAKANIKAMETLSGVIKGKFDYMSPEQASGNAIDQRTDLFAAGVLLYEMLCGEHPFRQPHEMKTVSAIRAGEYRPPSFVNPDVPYGLEVVLDQALARDPADRFPTATAFKEALTRFFHDAGFIFSHSTLAAFLKGLFPEANQRRRRDPEAREGRVPNLRDQETRPLSEDEELDAERPTTLDEASPPPPPRQAQPPPRPPPRQVAPPPRPPPLAAPPPAQPPVRLPPQAAAPPGAGSTITRRRPPPRRAGTGLPSLDEAADEAAARAAPQRPPQPPPSRLPRPPAPSGMFDRSALAIEGDTLLREIPPDKVRPPRGPAALPLPQRSVQGVEESTLIRPPDPELKQLLDEAREREARERVAEWSEERPTQVRGAAPPPRPQTVSVELETEEELLLDDNTQSHSATLELDEPSIAGAPPIAPPPVARLKPPAAAAAAPPRPRLLPLVVAGFVGVISGVFVGVVAGGLLGWRLAVDAQPPPPVPPPPALQIEAPAAARVLLNGRLKGVVAEGPLDLAARPDEPFTLKIEHDDLVLHEAELTLAAGETYRLRVVQAPPAAPTPKPKRR